MPCNRGRHRSAIRSVHTTGAADNSLCRYSDRKTTAPPVRRPGNGEEIPDPAAKREPVATPVNHSCEENQISESRRCRRRACHVQPISKLGPACGNGAGAQLNDGLGFPERLADSVRG
jgi:hypothetical protein